MKSSFFIIKNSINILHHKQSEGYLKPTKEMWIPDLFQKDLETTARKRNTFASPNPLRLVVIP